jgi:CheY-like chemotaxis protein
MSTIDTWRARFYGATPTILIVDDDPAVRELWKEILGDAAPMARLIEVEDGARAVQVATQLQPDVIVMDFQLPVLDGLDATRQLKAEIATVRIPVILVTGMECPVQDVLDAGCHGFIRKPLHANELVEQVARALRLPTP